MKFLFAFAISVIGISGQAIASDPALTWLGHAAFQYATRNGQTASL